MKTILGIIAFLCAMAVAGPVSHFGYLQTCKTSDKGRICGSLTGTTPVMVKGPSLFWSSGNGASFYRREVVDWFVDNMEIGVIRAAMAIKYNKEKKSGVSDENAGLISNDCASCYGYLSSQASAKSSTKALIERIIEAAIANDIYVMVDWHSHNANYSDGTYNEKTEAVAFFKEMANKYKGVPNLIWEIYNEPVSDDANTIKNYANDVIAAIRGEGNDNLVIVGSRQYSQEPNGQRQTGITDTKSNTAYSFHFYSNTHGSTGDIYTSANNTINAGYSVFATEWGSVNADGSGTPNQNNSANGWINFMDTANISGCYWSASAVNEGASIFKSGTTINDLITKTVSEVISSSGSVFQTYMGTKKWTSYATVSTDPRGKDISFSLKEGDSKTFSSTDLGLANSGTIKSVTLTDGKGEVLFTSNSITYNSEQQGSDAQAYINYVVTNGTKDVQQRIVINITDLRPVLPKQATKDVSRRAPTYMRLSSFSPSDPYENNSTMSFTGVSVNNGGIAEVHKSDSIKFTPPESIRDAESTTFELTYFVRNSTSDNASSQTITLNARNFAPTVPGISTNGSLYASIPNNQVYKIRADVAGTDIDKDPLTIVAFYMHEDYPGTMELNATKDTLTYTPASELYVGTVRFLVVVTDGYAVSGIGDYRLTLTGEGTDITADPKPTEIPGYNDETSIKPPVYAASGMSLQAFGKGKLLVNLAQSGITALDVYSISGVKVASLLNSHQNAGTYEFNLGNLQKGVYVARLKQGSGVKVLRIINQ